MESFGGLLFPLLILLLFIPIFLSGRKQRSQMQKMQQLQSALEDGDVVTTTSGLRGTVVDASYQETVDLEIAPGVVTTWLRAAVREKVAGGADDAALTDGIADDRADDRVDPVADDRPDTVVADRPRPVDVDRPAAAAAEPPLDTPSDTNGSHRP